jgi:transposase
MRDASAKIANRQFRGQPALVVARLRAVAKAFADLQQDRNTADYDSTRRWSRAEVLGQIHQVASAFETWKTIRKEQIAQDYLLSLLIKDRP